MIKLTKIFDMIPNERVIIVKNETKIYTGEVGECPFEIWRNAYVEKMELISHLHRYIIDIKYM